MRVIYQKLLFKIIMQIIYPMTGKMLFVSTFVSKATGLIEIKH